MHPPTADPGSPHPDVDGERDGVPTTDPQGRDGRGSAVRDTGVTLVRSAAAALVSVALPLVMTRALSADRYATWTIALQAFLYGTFLEVGVTLAVSRATAVRAADGRGSPAVVLAAGRRAAMIPISIGVAVYVALVVLTPWVYRDVPDALQGDTRWSVALMALASLISLASLPAQGFLLGAGSFAAASLPVAAGTAAAAVGATVAAFLDARIVVVAAVFALVRIATATVVIVLARQRAALLSTPQGGAERLVDVTREIRSLVGTMWIWSFAGFLGSGLDLTLVSWADYPRVRAYAVGAAITAALTGVAGALVTVVVPRIAGRASDAVQSAGGLARELRLASWAIALVALPLVASATPLSLMLGGQGDITLVLLAGAWLRVSMAPYVAAMVGQGDHRVLRMSPLVEGVCNLGLGMLLAPVVGAIGVAIATLVSGALGVALHLVRNLPRSSIAHITARSIVVRSTLPAIAAFAFAALCGSASRGMLSTVVVTIAVTVTGASTLLVSATTAQDRVWIARQWRDVRRRARAGRGGGAVR